MTRRQRIIGFLAAFAVGACDRSPAAVARRVPTAMTIVAAPPASATVGADVGPIVVRLTDAHGDPVSGVPVTFAMSRGAGQLARTLDTTRTDGTASTSYRVGTARATNEVEAIVEGLEPVRFIVVGVAAAPGVIAINPREVRIAAGAAIAVTTAAVRDTFGNPISIAVTWTPRDPSLVSISVPDNNGVRVQALRRPGQTYVVGTVGAAIDSMLVTVQDVGSPCSMIVAPVTLAVGGVTTIGANGCVRAQDSGAEYVLVAHYNTAVTSAFASISVLPSNMTTPDTAFRGASIGVVPPERDAVFEGALRQREAREITPYVPGARTWFRSRPPALRARLTEGDVLPVNVNAFEFCGSPTPQNARVAAVTQSSIILADESNPEGGFTDAEYRAFGELMDTLVTPVDTAAFGAPEDIDGNGRVIILFTRAVNDLTPAGSPNGIVLGFYYLRDLLPLRSIVGDCPGSNVAEMFYMLVPDPEGTRGNVREKSYVENVTASTIAHEFQHLINASRRMYVNDAPRVDEEPWLNEGLSHIAEELLFYRASGLAPRTDIGAGQLLSGSPARIALDADQINNLRRYREYVRNTEVASPLLLNDNLSTRGAAWSFLRFIADRTRATDGDFWRQLVNSRSWGTANIDQVLAPSGTTTLGLLHDWSVSVIADNIVSNLDPVYQQRSWNLPSAMAAASVEFPLVPRLLYDGQQSVAGLRAGGTSYMRFAVSQGQETLLQVTGVNGRPYPAGIQLSIVRIR